MIDAPPAIYSEYRGPLMEVRRPVRVINVICRYLGAKASGMIEGCQLWVNGGCLIFVREDDDGRIRRHELAHCNGWSHS